MARGAAAKQARKESRKQARANGDNDPDGQGIDGASSSGDNSGLDGYFGPTDGDSTFDVGGERKQEKKLKKKEVEEEDATPKPLPVMGVADGDDPFGFKRQQAAEARRVAASSSCCGDDGCSDEPTPKKKKGKDDEVRDCLVVGRGVKTTSKVLVGRHHPRCHLTLTYHDTQHLSFAASPPLPPPRS
jgi:hypothetical protein